MGDDFKYPNKHLIEVLEGKGNRTEKIVNRNNS